MKKAFSIILFSIFCLCANAQYTDYWTTEIPLADRPAASTVPADTLLTGLTTTRQTFTVDVPGTLDNATTATAFSAIGAAAMDSVMSQYAFDVWALDTTNHEIILGVVVTDITRRAPEYEPNDRRNQYKVATNVFRVSGYAKYAINPE